MKNLEEIKKTPNLFIEAEAENDGMGGHYYDKYNNKNLNFIFSYQLGWEHLSVSMPNKTPSWEQMCMMKDIFWGEDEVCMQLHPAKENYIDNMPYCLHIWRPINKEIPTPPNLMVGIRTDKQKFKQDIKEFIQKSTENGERIDEETKKELQMMGVDI